MQCIWKQGVPLCVPAADINKQNEWKPLFFDFRSFFTPFYFSRKLRKSTKMVYNRLETKNDIAKERRCDFATTLSMRLFVVGLGCTI